MIARQELSELENALLKLENLNASFDYLKIKIASPRRIKSWSERVLPSGEIIGEVLRPETINFRTHQPESSGLFCEKIFGPVKNWKCRCGKYNGFAIDKICEECQVEVIESRVRRYRTGYIELVSPVTHLWYLKGIPGYLTTLLKCLDNKLSTSKIEKIVYFKDGLDNISEHNTLDLFKSRDTKSENELLPFLESLSSNKLESKSTFSSSYKGSEILKAALENLNISLEIKKARSCISNSQLSNLKPFNLPDKSLIRRIRILESFYSTGVNPSWMILTILPVLPPTLRPLVELENGRLVSSDINEIYRLIITRNQRLTDFLCRYGAPDLISIQGRKLLQESVDSLIDNARLPKTKIFCLNNRALKSLTEILEGKQGRFRQSLLGKRVDYSGRSVIIVGPTLRLNECGLPYEVAIELFQPFLINELLKAKIRTSSHHTKLAHLIIKKNKPFIWSLLEQLAKKHCVLLNRAPTLHRFGIQAFNPTIVLGQAIHLHPLACTGFNADFDGDQMAIHLPLYDSSQLEARTMMRPSYNILSSSNGEVILKPSQDMVIGCYYLTLLINRNACHLKKWFANEEEVLCLYYQKKLAIHTPVLVRYEIQNLYTKIDQEVLQILDSTSFKNQRDIKIYKKLISKNDSKKQYLLTNIGILIAYLKKDDNRIFQITDLLLETTPGRIIFSLNIKHLIK
jgi:DNA-directed RNA polymerase subunit beta'